MANIIGIRREDKNKWERRVPLTPEQVAGLIANAGLQVIVQSSPIRAFADGAYAEAGATIQPVLAPAAVVLAVKEIPLHLLRPNTTYLFFSHTIKGQPYNMPLLQKLLDLNCQLIDYERIVDDDGRRLIFFGRHAGLAGMIDTLHTLGQRLAWEGLDTPLNSIKLTYQYDSLAAAQQAIRQAGRRIAEEGLPGPSTPLVVGVAGYGNVGRGAQEILDLLPVRQLAPADLLTLAETDGWERNVVYKVIFKEVDTVEPVDASRSFELQEFFEQPERYRSKFEQYLPHLTVLVNCIYWDTPYPRLLTKAQMQQLFDDLTPPRLRVIGDLSCDIEGGIEITVKPTSPDAPAFVWDVTSGEVIDGVAGNGPVVMAIDNLPCELPRESSTDFGAALLPFVPALAAANFTLDFNTVALPPALKRATIVYHGRLTPEYRYLEKYISIV